MKNVKITISMLLIAIAITICGCNDIEWNNGGSLFGRTTIFDKLEPNVSNREAVMEFLEKRKLESDEYEYGEIYTTSPDNFLGFDTYYCFLSWDNDVIEEFEMIVCFKNEREIEKGQKVIKEFLKGKTLTEYKEMVDIFNTYMLERKKQDGEDMILRATIERGDIENVDSEVGDLDSYYEEIYFIEVKYREETKDQNEETYKRYFEIKEQNTSEDDKLIRKKYDKLIEDIDKKCEALDEKSFDEYEYDRYTVYYDENRQIHKILIDGDIWCYFEDDRLIHISRYAASDDVKEYWIYDDGTVLKMHTVEDGHRDRICEYANIHDYSRNYWDYIEDIKEEVQYYTDLVNEAKEQFKIYCEEILPQKEKEKNVIEALKAYEEFINQYEYSSDYSAYKLVYLDDDEIPEVFAYTGLSIDMLHYNNGKVDFVLKDVMYRYGYYNEREGLLYAWFSDSSISTDYVAEFNKGQVNVLFAGGYSKEWNEDYEQICLDYTIRKNNMDVKVTEEEYANSLEIYTQQFSDDSVLDMENVSGEDYMPCPFETFREACEDIGLDVYL